MDKIRVLILDDEVPARERIEDLLGDYSDVEIVKSIGDPVEAVEFLRTQAVDMVFLDMQMPEMGGLDVIRAVGVGHMPPTIFVTAYDQYALEAFDVAAVDYLLKPFDDDRFVAAMRRARDQLRRANAELITEKLRTLLGAGASTSQTLPAASTYLERIIVDRAGHKILISVDTIDYVEAFGPYCKLHVAGTTYHLRERMHALEQQLDPRKFCRIHRSTIVNIDRIVSFDPLFRGDHIVRLRDGARVKLSRTHRQSLEDRIGYAI